MTGFNKVLMMIRDSGFLFWVPCISCEKNHWHFQGFVQVRVAH